MKTVVIRRAVLALALLASLIAAWQARQEDDSGFDTVPSKHESKHLGAPDGSPKGPDGERHVAVKQFSEANTSLTLDLDRLRRRQLGGTDVDVFRVKSWFDPPPPPPPEPPPKPTAPPFPFTYIGKTDGSDGGDAAFYLANGDEFLTVAIGERFGSSYQLEKAEKGTLFIRYLPLSILQTLPIGSHE
ncbi:MAG: hypothetical protein QM739_08460 [Propionivibrio sp.]